MAKYDTFIGALGSKGSNPEYNKPCYMDGPKKEYKELRNNQPDVYNRLKSSKQTLLVAPCGWGNQHFKFHWLFMKL